MRIISLGWGVQSFALAAMSALGELPPVDAAIHADTTHERWETYEFAERWTPWLEERGIRVVTVRPTNAAVYFKQWDKFMIPVYVGTSAKGGQIWRKCTKDWKIAPIRRWLQAHRNKGPVEQWLGITLDEWTRMRDSDVKYITHWYPFMDAFGQPWRRRTVLRWLQNNELEIPMKLSCVFCPYHDNMTWRDIALSENGDWEKAVDVDRMIRHARGGHRQYLHRSLQPLESVDLRNEQDHGQLELWGEECTGMCFL